MENGKSRGKLGGKVGPYFYVSAACALPADRRMCVVTVMTTQPAQIVFVLLDSRENVIAIHRTREGAEAHRANFVLPSHVTIEEWDLEP